MLISIDSSIQIVHFIPMKYPAILTDTLASNLLDAV